MFFGPISFCAKKSGAPLGRHLSLRRPRKQARSRQIASKQAPDFGSPQTLALSCPTRSAIGLCFRQLLATGNDHVRRSANLREKVDPKKYLVFQQTPMVSRAVLRNRGARRSGPPRAPMRGSAKGARLAHQLRRDVAPGLRRPGGLVFRLPFARLASTVWGAVCSGRRNDRFHVSVEIIGFCCEGPFRALCEGPLHVLGPTWMLAGPPPASEGESLRGKFMFSCFMIRPRGAVAGARRANIYVGPCGPLGALCLALRPVRPRAEPPCANPGFQQNDTPIV